ncbi:MAG: tetratricopeptide repeat protein [Alphaproteobacteria bacterium]|nr:tetratricopeptide repeat protein [Acidobacteriota bacterium]MBV9549049.1 tetratricopeptide repeat protein [Alphaproteobacteria bacterium]
MSIKEPVDVDFGGRILRLPARGFFGQFSRSPNSRYILTWRDGNDAGTVGGARSEGQGRYILLQDEQIICEGRMDRPNDGKVADDGTFILNDWHFFTMELRGTFCAFRPSGETIISRQFKANLYNNGLATDGRWACCQTCNSDDEDDSSALTTFDLTEGREIASWHPESGWANEYAFGSGEKVSLTYLEGPPVAYSLAGEFIDRQLWLDNGLSRGELRIIGTVLNEAPQVLPKELARKLVGACDRGLRRKDFREAWSQAWGLRLQGECYDRSGDLVEALACYDKALQNDPKVGVKRRAQQIRKALSK